MKCPRDDATLQLAEREGIEIDYCPQCRGVWLDGRELDRIIERAMAREEAGRPVRPEYPSDPERDRDRDRERHGHDREREYGHDQEYGHRKRKDRLSFLGELLGGD